MNRRSPLWPTMTAFALLCATLFPPGVASQATPALPSSQDAPRKASASLLHRLAAAADGYRTGEPVWIVASYAFPHPVAGVFPDSASAAAAASELQRRGPYAVFGPYVTPRDFDRPPVLILVPHWPPTIRDGTDSLRRRLPEVPWLMRDVDSLTMMFHGRDRAPLRVAMRSVPDVLFFTLAALDKFAIPYYTDLEGSAGMARWRDSLATYIRLAPPQ